MSDRRIDELRHRVAAIGRRQAEYHRFFPAFADHLVVALGTYLGDPTAVALTVNEGSFDFDHEYRHTGVTFDQGFYRIPVMVRIDNLEDDGSLLIRFRLFCELRDGLVYVAVDDDKADAVDAEGELNELCEWIFARLRTRLSEDNFIDTHPADHNRIAGFGRSAAS